MFAHLLSDDELFSRIREEKQKLAALENEYKQRQNEALNKRQTLILRHIDVLLDLIPDHDRTSCSDREPCNDNGRCVRCTLLSAKHEQFCSFDIEIFLKKAEYAN